jgi:hypothetical protein
MIHKRGFTGETRLYWRKTAFFLEVALVLPAEDRQWRLVGHPSVQSTPIVELPLPHHSI